MIHCDAAQFFGLTRLSFAELQHLVSPHQTHSRISHLHLSNEPTVTMQEDTHDIPSAATALLEQMADSEDDLAWTKDLPPVEESAPGDKLYDTLEDFVADMSDGEESSDSEVESTEESENKDGEDVAGEGEDHGRGCGTNMLASTIQSANNTQPGSSTQPEASEKNKHTFYTDEHKLVLFLLRQHHRLSNKDEARVFNHIFRAEGIVRGSEGLRKRWSAWKEELHEKLSNPTQDELAGQDLWKQKINGAKGELGIA